MLQGCFPHRIIIIMEPETKIKKYTLATRQRQQQTIKHNGVFCKKRATNDLGGREKKSGKKTEIIILLTNINPQI